ncbi:hypothetical protein GCM10020000_00030 [Streptomyces olivoverticillatus]
MQAFVALDALGAPLRTGSSVPPLAGSYEHVRAQLKDKPPPPAPAGQRASCAGDDKGRR